MSTESRIEARDAKAAGGVVAEGRAVLATFGQESWRVVVDDDGYANLHFASEDECLGDILATVYQDDEYAHGIAWMRNNLATLLDALAAAQAREAGLREALSAADVREARLRTVLDGATQTDRFQEDDRAVCRAFITMCRDYRAALALSTPTPEAPDHD